ncbi:helix-turn-helix domain-containing protein, partial [Gemmatimonadota bacterium]
PGRRIEAQDIPGEVRYPRSRGLLPAPILPGPIPVRAEGDASLRPELEFVFRTLVNLRMDIDDLRRDFQRYKEEGGIPGKGLGILPPGGFPGVGEMREVFPESAEDLSGAEEVASSQEPQEDLVVFRPGMTMDQMEEQAIRAVLMEVGGNRRKAAEQLEIGERTLYRKIKKYGLED